MTSPHRPDPGHLDHADYLSDVGPGTGRRRPARSALTSTAPSISLNGPWRFRLLPAAPGTPAGRGVLPEGEAPQSMAAPGYDDSGWDLLELPCHWVLAGDGRYGRPIYTNVQLPFPQDPPHPPDENPTGDHRRQFTVPTAWLNPDSFEAIVLRFDGVESRYRVWVNGESVGTGTGSRLAQEFDVTGLVHAGVNTIAVRVHQWSASTYVEDQDQWWLPGIFRDVTVQARPFGGLDDVWIRAEYDETASTGTLATELRCGPAAYPVRLCVPELGIDETWAGPKDVGPRDDRRLAVGAVEPWSAETPRLYDAWVTSAGGETITLRLGFRTVRIEGDRFLVNGRRVVFHGMNRHETHPDRGRVFDEAFAREDLAAMKRANVNAIRTAHYPPHPRLLDLADELGLWVMVENDLETHCFHHGGDRDEWFGNPCEDPAWRDGLLDRMERTVERDKNHPSVVMWSLGNESGTGANLAAMAQWVRSRDPGRPVHYEGDHAGDYTDVYSRMYPSVPEVESIGSASTRLLLNASGAQSARQRTRPFLLCEYVHAMGNGPGGIDLYERLVDRYPRLHGGFVWEWRDHGIRTRTPGGVEYFGYGGDFGEVVHDGPFCMDGMVLADGTPTPGLAEFAAVVSPIRFALDGDLVVTNHRHSADTRDLAFRWRVEHDGEPVGRGELEIPGGPLAAGDSARLRLPAAPIAERGETWLTVEAALAGEAPWAKAGHVVAASQFDLTPVVARPRVGPAPAAPTVSTPRADAVGHLALGPARFVDGNLVELAGLAVRGPRLELWRAPTANDGGSHMPSYDRNDPTRTWEIAGPGEESYAAQWRRAGMDRIVGRVLEVARTEAGLLVRTRYGAADNRPSVELAQAWSLVDGELWLRLDIVPSSRWDVVWPRVGVRFDLPTTVDHAAWFGTGPQDSYPDSHHAALVGRYSATTRELFVNYAVPQENGHHSGLRSLTLGEGTAPRLTLDAVADQHGRLPGFTLSRHTAQELDAARHPHELPDPLATYLYLDAAQNGLGSRACGPDVWPDALLRPEARTVVVKIAEA